jgi:protein phosphatase
VIDFAPQLADGLFARGESMVGARFVFDTGAATHPGAVRKHNEDSYLVRPAAGVWLVSDGMGGHKAGDFASRTIVENVNWVGIPTSAHDLKVRFMDRLQLAHEDIRSRSQEMEGATVGATIVSLLIYGPHYACIWSGDSRMYRLRDGQLQQMTIDHTEVNELLTTGTITAEQAAAWPRKNVITRAIGVLDEVMADENYGSLQHGDTFLLCSDGLTGHVRDDELLESLAQPGAQQICDRLIELTLSRGARDNVTVIVVRCLANVSADEEEERTRPGNIPLVSADDWKAEH